EDGTPRRYEFTINLKRIDDGRIDLLGSVSGTLGGILRGLL
ncbi:oxidoreductase, partial [Pseudomonas aeruginosa]|nr:oxidoreductase [Pseudomonas aeruginosa]